MFYTKKKKKLYVTSHGYLAIGNFLDYFFYRRRKSILQKEAKKIRGSGGMGELLHPLGYKKGSITKTVPSWAWIYKLHRAPLFTEMQKYMHEKFSAADIL